MNRSKTVVVCDAGPLIHLDEIGCLRLMSDFERVIVPFAVREEVCKHRPLTFDETDIVWTLRPAVFPLEETSSAICKVFSLDAGEVEAISLLNQNPMSVFLTDDAAARIVAAKIGFRVHGTVGILIRSIRRGLLDPTEVVEALQRIRDQSTLYIRGSLLQEAISKIRREYNI